MEKEQFIEEQLKMLEDDFSKSQIMDNASNLKMLMPL